MKPTEHDQLEYAMSCNPLSFKFEDIEEILSVVDGEHDAESWHFLLKLKDGSHKYVYGGCDYTGWDCQSSLSEIDIPKIDDLNLVVETDDYHNRPIREIFKARKFVNADGTEYK